MPLQEENDFIKTRAYTGKVRHCTFIILYISREIGNGFGVRLDFRALRTPLRKLFIVPREQLAVGVAQEWAGQSDVIVPSHMHLVSILGQTNVITCFSSFCNAESTCLSFHKRVVVLTIKMTVSCPHQITGVADEKQVIKFADIVLHD